MYGVKQTYIAIAIHINNRGKYERVYQVNGRFVFVTQNGIRIFTKITGIPSKPRVSCETPYLRNENETTSKEI